MVFWYFCFNKTTSFKPKCATEEIILWVEMLHEMFLYSQDVQQQLDNKIVPGKRTLYNKVC